MDYRSFQAKIILIISIPMLVLIYFSYSFAVTKNKQLERSEVEVLAANATNILTNLIHNLQSERGLSAGYLVSHDKEIKAKLLAQYTKSDVAYKVYLEYLQNNKTEQKQLRHYLSIDPSKKLLHISTHFDSLKEIRKKILQGHINLEDELKYYTLINSELLHTIDLFVALLNNKFINNSFSQLQTIKEIAGLQRAYIFNHILKKTSTDQAFIYLQELEIKRNIAEENFILSAPSQAKSIYDSILKEKTSNLVESLKKRFFTRELTQDNAHLWFEVSSLYIDQLNLISQKIISNSIINANESKTAAKNALYLSSASWIFSIIAYLFLLYTINILLAKEKKLSEKLRISSYIFDSHEAMVLTSPRGTIVQVNKAFTSITGYTKEDAIGENIKILKSSKHSTHFYEEMWKQLMSEGKWSNEIYNKRKNGEVYLERLSITAIKDSSGVLINYIAQFLDISDLKNAQESAQHQADHDFLTGLINRKALMKRLQEEYAKATRHKFTHAFFFIDLDNFKNVNDTYGHLVGDQLLIEVSARVQALLREEDLFSRISGDEFVIMMLNIDSNRPTAALQVKEKCNTIINELSKEFIINGNQIHIGASIGIKIFPNKESQVEDVIAHADTAMYQAKNNGKNTYAFFDSRIEANIKELAILEKDLKLAIENKEFVFYLQPKTTVESGSICAAEALIRWQHPKKGLLFPGDFLEVASSIGLIPDITWLALSSVCQFLQKNKEWQGIVSINIQAHELRNPHFERTILDIIEKYGVDIKQIELEILEDDLIQDIEQAVSKISRLRDLGLQFAIDDFGTGYSSITYLQRLPVNNLKIDRSFTQNLHKESNRALMKMMISMAKTFNMKTVVEGVENEEQLEYIRSCGADIYQGFYCSPAVEEEKFIELLNKA